MSTIIKSGYLTKEGGLRKTWKKRWFVLRHDTLSYYRNEKDMNSNKKEYGIINLKDILSINPTNYKNKQFCLALVSQSRTYYLVAENNEDIQNWKEEIQKQVDKVTGRSKEQIAPLVYDSPNVVGVQNNSNSLESSSSSIDDATVSLDDFDLISVIGVGSYGKVVKCKHKSTGNIYALKMIVKKSIIDKGEIDHIKSERYVLQKVDHPFLLKLHYSFQTQDKLYFVMDFINGGELFFHLQNVDVFDNERAKFYASEILLALEYLHSEGIIYRDLKPENILLDSSGHIKITDFGLTKEGFINDDIKTRTICGTPEYLAPEVVKGQSYGKSVDWWSFGALIYEMLIGMPPFYDEDVEKMYHNKLQKDLEINEDIDKDAKDLIEKLLQRDPEKRLSDPSKIKSHPWFKGIDWDMILQKKVDPPYKPNIKDKESVENIDESFLEMTLTDVKSNNIKTEEENHFDDFTYVKEE